MGPLLPLPGPLTIESKGAEINASQNQVIVAAVVAAAQQHM
jgi:hypothetical protein